MKSYPESPYGETRASGAVSATKQASNPVQPTQAESLLAAEKQTLEKMANGASLSEVLSDLFACGSPIIHPGSRSRLPSR